MSRHCPYRPRKRFVLRVEAHEWLPQLGETRVLQGRNGPYAVTVTGLLGIRLHPTEHGVRLVDCFVWLHSVPRSESQPARAQAQEVSA